MVRTMAREVVPLSSFRNDAEAAMIVTARLMAKVKDEHPWVLEEVNFKFWFTTFECIGIAQRTRDDT